MAKKCIACGKDFKPLSGRQKTCSLQCTYDVAKSGRRGGFPKKQARHD